MKKIILKSATKKANPEKGGKAFYTVLFLAIVVVGTTGYIMRMQNNVISQLSDNGTSPETRFSAPKNVYEAAPEEKAYPPSDSTIVSYVPEEQWQSDDVLPVTEDISLEPDVPVFEETDDSLGNIAKASAEVTSLIYPVAGDIIKGHSDTELSYSKTMEDWRLHKGEDIKASIGSTVIAAAKGVISECYEDTAYGVTVIIDHGSGLFTKYSNMASTEMVNVGDEVSSGDVIGVVGDTAEFEIADEAHLHFEVIKDGRSIDPKLYTNR